MGTDDNATKTTLPLTVSRPELLLNGTDSDFRGLVHRLLAFSARLETVRASFGAITGLSGIQYTTLISIAHLQGEHGVGVQAIAHHLSLSGAHMTIEIGKLVKSKLIKKRVNPDDKRRALLSITPLGKSLLIELATIQQEVNDVLFEPLDKKTFKMLLQLTKDLISSADKAATLSKSKLAARAAKTPDSSAPRTDCENSAASTHK